jgi:actin-like ATPase involved in cell morphogenesis
MLRQFLEYFRSDLALDLGTANTRISVVGEGGTLTAFGCDNEPKIA